MTTAPGQSLLKRFITGITAIVVSLAAAGCSTHRPEPHFQYPPIKVYVRDGCRHSEALEAFLKDRDIPYTRRAVNRDSQAMEEFRKLGVVGVPTTVIRSEIIRGNQPEIILAAARRYARRH